MCSKLNLESSVFIIILDMTSRRIMFAVYKPQSTIGLALRELKLNQEMLGENVRALCHWLGHAT